MKKKALGRSGIEVSEIGYGCGGFWGMKVFSEKEAHSLLDIAIENGINLFDTGPQYSNSNAEPRLGRFLKNHPLRHELVIGTKVGPKVLDNGKIVQDFSRKHMEQSLENSLKILNLDCIPLLQLHAPPSSAINDEVIEVLKDFKTRGLVKAIGLSVGGEALDKAIESGAFDFAMPTFSILNRHDQHLIKKASESGMGILAKSPLAHSLYSNKIFKIKKLSDIWYLLRALKNYRHELSEGMKYRFINRIPELSGSEIALNFVTGNPHINSAVIGTVTKKHLVQNVRAAQKPIPSHIALQIESVK